MRAVRTLGAILVLVVAACDATVVTPVPENLQGTLYLAVSGGVAGADFAYHVTTDGTVVADRCAALCTFQEGDTLRVLTASERSTLAGVVDASGIAQMDEDVEYPGTCCDYFTYEVTLTARGLSRTVRGPDATMPQEMANLVYALKALNGFAS